MAYEYHTDSAPAFPASMLSFYFTRTRLTVIGGAIRSRCV